MRVEIDEEKKGKRNGLCSIHQHRDEFIPPRPLINHLKESEQAHSYLSSF